MLYKLGPADRPTSWLAIRTVGLVSCSARWPTLANPVVGAYETKV